MTTAVRREPDAPARLDEFDKDEWHDVCRRVRPDIDDAEYDRLWAEFVDKKRLRKLQ